MATNNDNGGIPLLTVPSVPVKTHIPAWLDASISRACCRHVFAPPSPAAQVSSSPRPAQQVDHHHPTVTISMCLRSISPDHFLLVFDALVYASSS
jgi:hypothetical protein